MLIMDEVIDFSIHDMLLSRDQSMQDIIITNDKKKLGG